LPSVCAELMEASSGLRERGIDSEAATQPATRLLGSSLTISFGIR
jgi:hypothetical protein